MPHCIRCALVCVFTGFLHLRTAVRTTDDEEYSVDAGDYSDSSNVTEQCQEALRGVWRTVTYRDLFSPIFDGVYRIRSKYSGKYLTYDNDDHLGMSLHHYASNQMFDWKLKRVKEPGNPRYTLQSRKTNQYITSRSGNLVLRPAGEQHFQLKLVGDGIHRVLKIGPDFSKAIKVRRNGSVDLGDHVGLEDDSLEDFKGEWYVEQQLSWFRRPRTNKDGYERQFDVAGDIPMWENGTITWKDSCSNPAVDCAKGYADLRDRFKNMGLLSETHRRIVLENSITGSCDMTVTLMKVYFSYYKGVLEDLRSTTQPACNDHSLASISVGIKQAIQDMCFKDCEDALDEFMETLPCEEPKDKDAFWHSVVMHSECATLPSDHLEQLVTSGMMKRCMTYHGNSTLFTSDLKDDRSLVGFDGQPVCSVPKQSRSSKDIVQNGVCPSGTSCQCPSQLLRTRASTRNVIQGRPPFFVEGSSLESLTQDIYWSYLRRAGMYVLFRGMTVKAALLTTPSIWSLGSIGYDIAWYGAQVVKWRCSQTVACWPVRPKRIRDPTTKEKVCRIPDSAKSGGSRVWFMPPPGSQVRHRKWYLFRRCEVATCTRKMMLMQQVGFGPMEGRAATERTNIYNCQPLLFEDMTQNQTATYIATIRETLPNAYLAELN